MELFNSVGSSIGRAEGSLTGIGIEDTKCYPFYPQFPWYSIPLSTLFLFAFLGLWIKANGGVKSGEMITIIDQILSKVLLIKLYAVRGYIALYDRFLAQKGFRLKSATLRSSIPDLHCVMIDCLPAFRKAVSSGNNPVTIDRCLFDRLCEVHGCDSESSYLEIHYQFNEHEYTFIYTSEMSGRGVVVDYPLYHDEKIREFKSDVCHPHFTKPDSQNSLYALFGIDCKGIKGVRFNGDANHPFNAEIGERVMKHKGPMNDFGYLYQGDTRVRHLLTPQQLKEFKSLEIEYVAPYLDEDTFDIVPHVIHLKETEDHLLSPRMKSVLRSRHGKEGRR